MGEAVGSVCGVGGGRGTLSIFPGLTELLMGKPGFEPTCIRVQSQCSGSLSITVVPPSSLFAGLFPRLPLTSSPPLQAALMLTVTLVIFFVLAILLNDSARQVLMSACHN